MSHISETTPDAPPAPPRWVDAPVVAFDTETTGVNPQHDRIVTAALVTAEPLSTVLPRDVGQPAAGAPRTVQIQRWLLNPGIPIPEQAAAVHGVSTEEAQAHGRPAAEGVDLIASALADAIGAGAVVVVYNAGFDLPLLDAELARHGLAPMAERLAGEPVTVADPLVLDRAMDRYRKGKRRLGDLCAAYGVVPDGALHASDEDATVTLGVLAQIVARYPRIARHSGAELMTLQQDAHRQWAQNFRQWQARQGLTGGGPSDDWLPLVSGNTPSQA